MFTGIVEQIGKVITINKKDFDRDFLIEAPEAFGAKIGDSVAVNGICLTIREIINKSFMVSAANETLKLTNLSLLEEGAEVNIESSLTLTKSLGGHLVQGHIAGVTKITEIRNVGEAGYYKFDKPKDLDKYIVQQGFVTIDGMSITICEDKESYFEVMLIPHTLFSTIAKNYKVGTVVNLEVDIIARYVEKLNAK